MDPVEDRKDIKTESESVSQNLPVNAKEQVATLNKCPEKLPEVVQKLSCEVEEILKAQGVPKEDRDKIKLDLVSKLKEETLYHNADKFLKGLNEIVEGTIELEKENKAEQDQKQKEERQRYIQYLRVIQEKSNEIARALSKQIAEFKENSTSKEKGNERQKEERVRVTVDDTRMRDIERWVIG